MFLSAGIKFGAKECLKCGMVLQQVRFLLFYNHFLCKLTDLHDFFKLSNKHELSIQDIK